MRYPVKEKKSWIKEQRHDRKYELYEKYKQKTWLPKEAKWSAMLQKKRGKLN